MSRHVGNWLFLAVVSLGLGCSSAVSMSDSDGGVVDSGIDTDAAPVCEASCNVQFAFPAAPGVNSVELRGEFGSDPWNTGISLERVGDTWIGELPMDDGDFMEYKFVLNGDEWVLDQVNRSRTPDDSGNLNSVIQADCGCSEATFDWRDAILYFVFLDRFNDGDPGNNVSVAGVPFDSNYQGGDLVGLKEKIDEGYFSDLGVNALWITSPLDNAAGLGLGVDGRSYSAYHGYWPRDMEAIDARLGDLQDMQTWSMRLTPRASR